MQIGIQPVQYEAHLVSTSPSLMTAAGCALAKGFRWKVGLSGANLRDLQIDSRACSPLFPQTAGGKPDIKSIPRVLLLDVANSLRSGKNDSLGTPLLSVRFYASRSSGLVPPKHSPRPTLDRFITLLSPCHDERRLLASGYIAWTVAAQHAAPSWNILQPSRSMSYCPDLSGQAWNCYIMALLAFFAWRLCGMYGCEYMSEVTP